MTNHNNTPQPNRVKPFLVLLAGLLVVLGIIYMKRSSSDGKGLDVDVAADSTSRQVAVPDTTTDPSAMPAEPDTVEHYVLPDTIIGRDKRQPYEAGYEDGYSAGCDDGAVGQENETYDESNDFATQAAQQEYVRGYREGYAQGYDDGRQGKQFNI